MSTWKKAVSTLATAGLLASLLGTAVAGTASAATTYGTQFPYTASATTQVADGISYIDLSTGTENTAATVYQISVSGGQFINGTGSFAPSSTPPITYPRTSILLTSPTSTPTTLVSTGSHLWLASTAAGTATVTVVYNPGTGAVTDSIASFTFTAASATSVSTGYSKTTLSATTASANGGDTGVTATTIVQDANNVAIPAGATVTWTLSGPAYFGGTGTVTETDSTAPFVSSHIFSTGVPGPVTVATTVKYLNVTYTLANKTLTLVGTVAKVTVANNVYSLSDATTGAGNGALEIGVYDAAGQPIGAGVTFAIGAYTPAGFVNVDLGSAVYDSTDKAWDLDVGCASSTSVGTATVTIKVSTVFQGTTTTITSGPVTFTCADPLAADALGTFTIKAGATSVAPGGTTTISVSVLDDNGLPAPDGTVVTAAANAGAVVSSKGGNTKGTVNGVANFTYLAPATAGVATVTAFVTNAGGPHSVSISVGGVAAAKFVGSKLGLPATPGTYTAATKLAALGKYVTFRGTLGTDAASKLVGVYVAKKNSAGVWGAWTKLTSRMADASGNVIFYWRGSSAAWISVRFSVDGTTFSASAQARWR